MSTALESRVDSLMGEAQRRLEAGEYDEALKIGDELIALHFTGGFDVKAQALSALGQKQAAIKLLEDATARFPGAWPLWNLLGNLLSDEGRGEDARRAWSRGLEQPHADEAILRYNRALSFQRDARLEDALAEARRAAAVDRRYVAAHIGMRLFVDGQLFEEAVELGRRAIEHLAEEETEEPLAPVLREAARAHWTLRHDAPATIDAAWASLRCGPADAETMRLLREAMNRRSSTARSYRLVVRGEWPATPQQGGDGKRYGFFRGLEIVADSPGEALDLARLFEPEAVRPSLAIEEVKHEAPAAELLHGPYGVFGRILFPLESGWWARLKQWWGAARSAS